jgi:guanine deaminase
VHGYRAAILTMTGDPATDSAGACAWHEDGLLVVEGGLIADCGPYAALAPRFKGLSVTAYPGHILTPGFIDLHIHLPQASIIGASNDGLLDWLERRAFPAEAAFADPAHCKVEAARFLDELLASGTTTALVFGSSHKASVEALFDDAYARGMRLIAGKVLMDRGAPPSVLDRVETGRADTLDLIAQAKRGRLGYAVTPRFALTSSPEQLAMAGEIVAGHPQVWMQTHLAESAAEIEAAAQLFPSARDYLDVYARAGLVTDRSVFAHCVHLPDEALDRLGAAGSAIAHCPSSNLFLGSGLFSLKRALDRGVKVGIGTDVGGGDDFSIPRTLNQAYKVAQLLGDRLSAFQAFYMATLGGARALNLDDAVGSLEVGKEADFLLLDTHATPTLSRRLAAATTQEDRLFALMMLGDARTVAHTYVAGELRQSRDPPADWSDLAAGPVQDAN